MSGIVEIALLGLVLLAGGWSLGLIGRAGALAITAAVGVAGALSEPAPALSVPGPSPRPGLVGSDACAGCHPAEHASWSATYHRTMTQRATPEAVLGDFDGVELSDRGVRMRLEAGADGVYRAHLLDRAGQVLRTAEIALTTGSHHLQNYWMAKPDGWYVQLPFVWWVDGQRWLPVQDSFLQPDMAQKAQPAIWNDSCIYCHTVAGAGRVSADGAHSDPGVGELGIACEACHGPGEAHVRAQRNPVTRYRLHLDDDARAAGVARPDRVDHRREVAVCGQCHGVFVRTDMAATNDGADRFTVGDALVETRQLVLPLPHPTRPAALMLPPAAGPVPATLSGVAVEVVGYDREALYVKGPVGVGADRLEIGGLSLPGVVTPYPGGGAFQVRGGGPDLADRLPRALGWVGQAPTWYDVGTFWADGTIRTAGREANGLARSACFTEGTMTCGSCHQMHGAEPADQLAPGMRGDAACTGCHAEIDPAAHSHHPAGSIGCMDCHMPYTTFGLLTGIRAHRIDNPTVVMSTAHGRPNACSLCHVDRPLSWAAEHLERWYGQPPPPIAPPWDTVSATALWALIGDGAQRAVATSALGRASARAAGGATWSVPVLARLLDDDYAAVRKVAADGLRSLDLLPADYDFIGPPAARRAAGAAVMAAWRALEPDRIGPAVLVHGPGQADDGGLDRLRAARDRTPVAISE